MMKSNEQVQVSLRSSFWNRFREVVCQEGIPYQWKALNDELPTASPSHCMQNFRIAGGKAAGKFYGCVFQDSDAAKWLEGVAYSLTWRPDEALERLADQAIDDIVSAQQPDGYLNTYYILNGMENRWTNLMDNHELYCAGHMLEAAVAYYQATGKRKLLDAMIRYVDCIDSAIGPEEGKRHGYPGHPEIELALMRLYQLTQDPKHLKLAKYFVDQRGQAPLYFDEECRAMNRRCHWLDGPVGYQYYQAGKPVREQEDAEGHAVRAMYLYSGMADVALATGDESLTEACKRLWNSAVHRRMYITGGIGSTEYGEAFSFDYDLPNDTCYCETCASIALVFLARRMFRLDPRSEYADVMERALYNGIISGMQLDGKRFFYTNPLEVLPQACAQDPHKRHIKPERQEWFDCACCPPNLIRLLTSLQDYLYAVQGETLYVQLYAGGRLEAQLPGGKLCFTCQTEYPWKENVCFVCDGAEPVQGDMALRIPAWCSGYTLSVNGIPVEEKPQMGYVHLRRVWKAGDKVELTLAMPVTLYQAHSAVREDQGKLAVMRGPVVYCLEEKDNGSALHRLRLGEITGQDFRAVWTDELEGVIALESPGLRELTEACREEALYAPVSAASEKTVSLRWIPYYAWGNRGTGEMCVWVRR